MSNENPKRRWYQFSLRTLLLVMLVFCLTFGWIGSRMQQARDNRTRVAAVKEAVVALEKLGATVTSKYETQRSQTWLETQFDDPGGPDEPVRVLKVARVRFGPKVTDADLEHLKELTSLEDLGIGRPIREVYEPSDGFPYRYDVSDAGVAHLKGLSNLRRLNLDYTNVTDTGLKHLKRLTNLQMLALQHAAITDDGLKHLKGLTSLQELDLNSTNVTDAGLEHLKGLTNLQELVLQNTKITGGGLEHLSGMTQLKRLYLAHTQLTDAGLEHLKTLTQLEHLQLQNTKITDAGLAHLKRLKSLKHVGLYDTNVTFAGVKNLQQALPNCEIWPVPDPRVIEPMPTPFPNPFK